MTILKKNLIFIIFLTLIISISGCSGKKTSQSVEELRVGTEGLSMNFLPNNPPDIVHAEQDTDPNSNRFDAILELRNKGAYPELGKGTGVGGLALNGRVYLGGYDPSIVVFFDPSPPVADLNTKTLEGKTSINPNGGVDFVTFKGRVSIDTLNAEKYEPILLATACYSYETIASSSVCIDPNPYSTIKEKKVCEVKGVSLSSQGAPIAITQINEEAFATKTQFRITIKNVGNGEVMRNSVMADDKCNPFGDNKVEREDIDKVYLYGAKIANKELQCGPFDGNLVKSSIGYIRLVNSEGSIICEMPSSNYGSKIAYISPLEIRLGYVYRTTAQKKMLIKREPSGLGSSSTAYPTTESMPSSAPSSSTELPSTSSPSQSVPLQDGQTYLYCAESDPLTGECIRTADSCPKRDPGTGECIT
ncbi:hypothetical protein HYW20_08770 [Candidatus Woesearchaeota archaeon]|nr:hypothetical protein [Candidatus Woesearchaeota archaeon]